MNATAWAVLSRCALKFEFNFCEFNPVQYVTIQTNATVLRFNMLYKVALTKSEFRD